MKVPEKVSDGIKSLFWFMVDDMLIVNDIYLEQMLDESGFCSENNDIFSIHLKLSPNIQYSHTNDMIIRLPRELHVIDSPMPDDNLMLKFTRSDT